METCCKRATKRATRDRLPLTLWIGSSFCLPAFADQPDKVFAHDIYAKFLHYSDVHGKLGGKTIFGPNASNKFGMAYGFSLDENPNVGDAT
ncbi:hypothetical protein CSC3H3_07375 [Thalassospira marina]|uniref:Outer membrane porin, OprD family n=1 Tax=Thalassospira marina TaxID=2048283 RepID=A0ABN5FCN6_9PROT|nr:hypothetical protein CSC3H3_07375 [Thalassospira marina]